MMTMGITAIPVNRSRLARWMIVVRYDEVFKIATDS